MKQDHSVRNGIIVTVVGGLILSAILSALGYLAKLAAFLGAFLTSILSAATKVVELPIWAVVALVFGWLILVAVLAANYRRPSTTMLTEAQRDQTQLDTLQMHIVSVLIEANGKRVSVGELNYRIEVNHCRLVDALERLIALGLIEQSNHPLDGPLISISRTGRQRFIREGLL